MLATFLRKTFIQPIYLPAPVICVGNINVGGTGKTQIVIWLANFLKQKNINFVIVTKGYGSKLKGAKLVNEDDNPVNVGDESVLLAKYAKVIAAKKIELAIDIIKSLKAEVIIVDDGLQNPRFHKDLSILAVDESKKFQNGFLLPAGPLRQYASGAFKIVDLVIIVGNNIKTSHSTDKGFLDKTSIAIINAHIIPSTKVDKTKNYIAFCGIGYPERFFATLTNYGLNLIKSKIFPDHHYYSKADIDLLKFEAENLKVLLITTSKDYVKIQNDVKAICFEVALLIEKSNILEKLIYEKILKKYSKSS